MEMEITTISGENIKGKFWNTNQQIIESDTIHWVVVKQDDGALRYLKSKDISQTKTTYIDKNKTSRAIAIGLGLDLLTILALGLSDETFFDLNLNLGG